MYAQLSLPLLLLDCGRDPPGVVTPNIFHPLDDKPIPVTKKLELVPVSSISAIGETSFKVDGIPRIDNMHFHLDATRELI